MNPAQTIVRRRAVAILIVACLVPAWAQKADKAPPSIRQIEAAIQRDPDNPKLHVNLGLAYWDRNDYPHALEAFQRAEVDQVPPRRTTGWGRLDGRPTCRAPSPVKKAVAPIRTPAYTNLGSALAKRGDLDAAVDASRRPWLWRRTICSM
jgi:tetratricopeptide (TPR) repeat protein